MYSAIGFGVLFTALTSGALHHYTGVAIPTHRTDVQPDYPGGFLGFSWLASNVLVWGAILWFVC